MEKLAQKTGTTYTAITNRNERTEESITGIGVMVKEINTSVKENAKDKRLL